MLKRKKTSVPTNVAAAQKRKRRKCTHLTIPPANSPSPEPAPPPPPLLPSSLPAPPSPRHIEPDVDPPLHEVDLPAHPRQRLVREVDLIPQDLADAAVGAQSVQGRGDDGRVETLVVEEAEGGGGDDGEEEGEGAEPAAGGAEVGERREGVVGAGAVEEGGGMGYRCLWVGGNGGCAVGGCVVELAWKRAWV